MRAPPVLALPFLATLLAGPAAAQSVAHGALEDLFGEPVTTSATGKPQRASDVPANMEIITADDIRRSGADNIPDILRFVSGLDVRRYGFAAADVGVRGYNETSNPRLLVLVNGQQVYLDDLGRTQWYTLPVVLEEIRQIEVVKGPNTALFGFNAASGVINIVTFDPLRDKPLNMVVARAGTQGYSSLTAIGTGQIENKGGIRVSVDGFQARDFEPRGVAPDDLAFRSSPQRRAGNVDVRVQAAPGIELFGSGAVVNTRTWEATASPYFGTDTQRTNWARIGASADTSLGLLGLSVYRNELRYTYNGFTEREDLHDTVVVVQASDLIKLGSHTVRLGLDYRNNAASSSSVLAGKVGYEVFSGSAVWDWQITPRVSLTNAARFDHFVLNQHGELAPDSPFGASSYRGRSINEPSFNSGLVWRATDLDTLRLTTARGLQLPSIYELGLQDRESYSDATYLYLGQPHSNAASVSNVELGWDRSIPALRSTLRTALFAQRTDNILTNPYEATPIPSDAIQGGGQGLLTQAGNFGHSNAVGGEVGLRGKAGFGTEGELRWNVSYSYISIADHTSINTLYSPQDFQHGTPTHAVVLGAGVTQGRWEADLHGRWQSSFRDYSADPDGSTLTPVTVGNYVVLNGRLAYKLTESLTLALTAQQFNNSRILQSAAPPVERRLFLTATARF